MATLDDVLLELQSQRVLLEGIDRRLRTLETDLTLVRRAHIETGKTLAMVIDRCDERGEILAKLTHSSHPPPP